MSDITSSEMPDRPQTPGVLSFVTALLVAAFLVIAWVGLRTI